jgi:hypothetical protein
MQATQLGSALNPSVEQSDCRSSENPSEGKWRWVALKKLVAGDPCPK